MRISDWSSDVCSSDLFAVILMTPDDIGGPVDRKDEPKHRARQNVVLELGYFFAKFGRDKVVVLIKDEVELPSDVMGIVYERMDANEGWKLKLARELKSAGFDVDLNNAV